VLEFGGPKGTVFGTIDLDRNTAKSSAERMAISPQTFAAKAREPKHNIKIEAPFVCTPNAPKSACTIAHPGSGRLTGNLAAGTPILFARPSGFPDDYGSPRSFGSRPSARNLPNLVILKSSFSRSFRLISFNRLIAVFAETYKPTIAPNPELSR
jgi:hypothetical protein